MQTGNVLDRKDSQLKLSNLDSVLRKTFSNAKNMKQERGSRTQREEERETAIGRLEKSLLEISKITSGGKEDAME